MANNDEFDRVYRGIGLCLELAPFELEHLQFYQPGGHHPVHLGDVLGDDGNYLVIQKLGQGGIANVWLCRDKRAEPLLNRSFLLQIT